MGPESSWRTTVLWVPLIAMGIMSTLLAQGAEEFPRQVPGVVIVKLAPVDDTTIGLDEQLGAIRRRVDFLRAEKVFPRARPRPAGTPAPLVHVRGESRVVPDLGRTFRLRLPETADVEAVVSLLRRDPIVEWAEPDYITTMAVVPDDPLFSQEWHLHNTGQYRLDDADIDAPEAWELATGSVTVTMAILNILALKFENMVSIGIQN